MKLIRRWFHRRRIAHWQAIVRSIIETRDNIPSQLAQAERHLGSARLDLTFVDIERPPVSRAMGSHRRDGVDRNKSTPFSRGVARIAPRPHNATNQRGN